MCGSKFFMGGHEEIKKVYLAKFQNFYYINPKKMGGTGPLGPPSSAPPGGMGWSEVGSYVQKSTIFFHTMTLLW